MANWCVPTDKLLNCVMCSRKVITNDPEKQLVPQRFIFSPWLPVGSAVLITMLCNFIALFLLKAQIWVDMAHRKLHRWRSTVSTALTAKLIWLTNKCSYLKIKNKYKKLRKMTERRWIFIPNSVTAIWKDKTSRGPRTSFRCCARRCAPPKTSCQAKRLLGDEGRERRRMRLINVSYMVAHRMEAAQEPRPHHKSKPKSDFTYRKHLSRKPTYTHHNPPTHLTRARK